VIRKVLLPALAFVFVLALWGCGPSTKPEAAKGGEMMRLELKSSAFAEGGTIPKKYTCDGQNISPPLSWTAPPKGTNSLALVCDDPDAPGGVWVHWVLFGLAPETKELPEAISPQEVVLGGAKQGRNDFGKLGYGGPCPPRERPAHRYFFRLYALDFQPNLKAGATKQELLKAIQGHILAEGQLMGRYER